MGYDRHAWDAVRRGKTDARSQWFYPPARRTSRLSSDIHMSRAASIGQGLSNAKHHTAVACRWRDISYAIDVLFIAAIPY
eukprot:scaffold3957_cov19-Prasinocladus_malaysianus.AAC.2